MAAEFYVHAALDVSTARYLFAGLQRRHWSESHLQALAGAEPLRPG
jgi:hypothetical protein